MECCECSLLRGNNPLLVAEESTGDNGSEKILFPWVMSKRKSYQRYSRKCVTVFYSKTHPHSYIHKILIYSIKLVIRYKYPHIHPLAIRILMPTRTETPEQIKRGINEKVEMNQNH